MRAERSPSTTDRPIDDDERELMGSDHWDWERVDDGTPNPSVAFTFEVRFAGDALKRLTRAARAERSTVHAYVERLVLARLEADSVRDDRRASM